MFNPEKFWANMLKLRNVKAKKVACWWPIFREVTAIDISASNISESIFQPTNYTPPAPITMPIFNASGEQQPVQTGN